MPIKFTNRANALTILWESLDGSQTATFQVPKQATEQEQFQAMAKALAFLGNQLGVLTPASAPVVSPVTSAMTATATPASKAPASSGGQILMMPPASLSELPAGGAPAKKEFWDSMPTLMVPENLAGDSGGAWEMIPEGER